ncbi:G-D-S-L family lipolytic protein [Bizionia gelidisalsuginis]|uniref:G-D-S-L family lipolytic protein n=2 Tax=Bizionia TaxID=283785 RepID=A0A8H2LHH0_9FLAO|nr:MULTISPECIES: G-D-S-L family lipolytic protein [Bizionia]TYB75991.1 G-D-S-L family lipolytic protein [Bizionia saleffrena]TYC13494.1 G-D-S-L family lipolytic protein [Bizionia gelidisalsuginis]
MKTKYIWLLAGLISFAACESDDDSSFSEPLPALTAGSADFSNFVSLGNSLTAGFSDGALYKIAQQNSTPRILANQFVLVGGGDFTQPLMNDNVGGLLAGGNPLPNFGPRLVFDGSGPVPITDLNPGATTTTDIILNNPAGPFNNMGVPGAKSFHLLAPNYGDLSGLFASPPTANPYFVRMASSPSTSVISDAMAQNPSFFSLWIGNNDVLGYALSGGDGSNPITDQVTFDFAYTTLIGTLTTGETKGVIANIPDVTSIPHFTTVPYNPIPLDLATANAVNNAYATYNGGLLQAESFALITADERAARTIVFAASLNNAVVIEDESLTDLSGLGIPNYRQATAGDLFVLPASSFIGTEAVEGNPLTVNGVAIPLADKWVLIPSEQAEIAVATASFNATIQASATGSNLAFVDTNRILNQLALTGISSGDYILTSDLVTGGAFSLDGVHPTSRGYALIANEFLKSIDAQYNSNFEASGNLVNIANYNTNYSAGLQ